VLTLVTDDVDDRVQTLRAAGVAIEKEPVDNPEYRIYQAFVRDPDGHLVEIQRFWDPGWRTANRGPVD
jgi:catechol 2,3-dioxygenase-like lactoylglutathione lyase family enzyme